MCLLGGKPRTQASPHAEKRVQGSQKFLHPPQFSVCLVMTTTMVMEEKTKIGRSNKEQEEWLKISNVILLNYRLVSAQ